MAEIAEFVIIARGGKIVVPQCYRVRLSSEDPHCISWIEDEHADFDEWCNFVLNDHANEWEDYGASVIVFSLEEWQALPKLPDL